MKAIMLDKEELKSSGIEWIGEIPQHWHTENIKYHFDVIAGATPDSKNPEYWDGDITWVTPADYRTEDKYVKCGKRSLSLAGYQACSASLTPKGSIIFSKRAPIGTVALSTTELCTNQGCLACVPKASVNSTYYYYVMSIATEEFELKGAGTTFKEISANNFLNTKLPCLGCEEQQVIANYLDDRCSKIDAIIAEAKASIEEYQELKQAVIYEAVTKGINHTQCKHIDIDYLDDMPVNWHISSIGLLFQFIGGYAYKSDRFIVDSNFQVIRIGNVKDNNLVLERNPVFISAEYATESNNAQIQVDDILFTMTGTKGKGDYFYTLIIKENDLVNKKLFVNQRVGCFRKSNSNIYMAYYNYLLKMPKIREYVFLFETGTANQGNIGIEVLNRIKLYCPPYDEQVKIVDYLDNKTERIDNLISEKQSLIEDLESYKKSLIYEVVTGKRKVVA